MPVANSSLRHLRDEGLRITQQQVRHRAGPFKHLLDKLRFHPKAQAGTLHHRATGNGITTHEKCESDYALIAHNRDFN